MLTIETWRDPYDAGFSLTRPRKIELQEGLTVLIGCNGYGKTTLLHNINEACGKDKTPCYLYDNLSQGGDSAVSKAAFHEDFGLVAGLLTSSEGESIKLNFGMMSTKVRGFLKTGVYDDLGSRLARAFRQDKEEKNDVSNKRVLLFDALDSGLSVDSVVEIRDVFDLMMEDAKKLGIELYIVASANEYELARKAPCFDVGSGRYVEIGDYEAYRMFVLVSRQRKEARNEKAEKKKEASEKKKEEARAKQKAAKRPAPARKESGKKKEEAKDTIEVRTTISRDDAPVFRVNVERNTWGSIGLKEDSVASGYQELDDDFFGRF